MKISVHYWYGIVLYWLSSKASQLSVYYLQITQKFDGFVTLPIVAAYAHLCIFQTQMTWLMS